MNESRKDSNITLRRPAPADAPAVAQIVYDAFGGIARARGFPPDFPTLETTMGMAAMICSHPAFYGVIAETDGRIVGSNFLDERDPIRGVGPITVDPTAQKGLTDALAQETAAERERQKQMAQAR